MTSIPEPAEALQQILEEKAVRLARETGFIERERTFTGADFAQALILGWLHRPDERIDGFVQVLERREVSITGNIQGNTYANAGIQQTTINSLNNFINGPAPGAGLSPSSLSFGAQVINTTSTAQSAILTNNGTRL